MTENTDAAAGVAALAICESLLLALGNQKLLSVQGLANLSFTTLWRPSSAGDRRA
jgi:hypothetical protein